MGTALATVPDRNGCSIRSFKQAQLYMGEAERKKVTLYDLTSKELINAVMVSKDGGIVIEYRKKTTDCSIRIASEEDFHDLIRRVYKGWKLTYEAATFLKDDNCTLVYLKGNSAPYTVRVTWKENKNGWRYFEVISNAGTSKELSAYNYEGGAEHKYDNDEFFFIGG